MDRAEKFGLGAAVVGHLVLFGLLSTGFLATPNPLKLSPQPIEISLAPEVAIEQTSPEPAAEAALSVAPEEGAPEEAAPPAEEPETAPSAPAPEPAPLQPAPPKAAPPKPSPPKPVAQAAPKLAPAPKPVPKPKPQPRRPTPAAEAPAPARPTPARPAPARPAARPEPARPAVARTAPARPVATRPAQRPAAAAARGTGAAPTATATRARGSRLGDDFLNGLSDRPSPARAQAAPAAKMGAQAAANIGSAILRQVQPCANRQVTPGPGAERIRVAINLRLNRDGSLASRPRVVGHTGIDDDNRRYVDRVDDLAIATFIGCSPLQGLPGELYDVQNGWSNFTLRYKLPG